MGDSANSRDYACVGLDSVWEISVLSSNFVINLNLFLNIVKIKIILQRKNAFYNQFKNVSWNAANA